MVSRKHMKSKSKTARKPKHGAKKHKRAAKKTASRAKRGGMMAGLLEVAKTALVPFALYKSQKTMQRRKKSKNGKTMKRK